MCEKVFQRSSSTCFSSRRRQPKPISFIMHRRKSTIRHCRRNFKEKSVCHPTLLMSQMPNNMRFLPSLYPLPLLNFPPANTSASEKKGKKRRWNGGPEQKDEATIMEFDNVQEISAASSGDETSANFFIIMAVLSGVISIGKSAALIGQMNTHLLDRCRQTPHQKDRPCLSNQHRSRG